MDDGRWFWIVMAFVCLMAGLSELTSTYLKSAEAREAMRSGYVQKVDDDGNVIWVKEAK